jgi:hypothetical protein
VLLGDSFSLAPEFIPGFARGVLDGNRFNGFHAWGSETQTVETVWILEMTHFPTPE